MAVDIERVKQAHPIADVIAAHGVRLRPSGRRFVARCPFHTDDRPSLVVYPDTRSFHCFGCGASGDVIDFVRRSRGMGFNDALSYLGELPPAAAPMPPRSHAEGAPLQLSLDDRLILTTAAELYHETLLRSPQVLRYLESRGVPRWLAHRARLGYSDGHQLAAYLKRRRLSLRRAAEMGLFYPDERRNGAREAMHGRLVIPDLRGGYCGWMTGRALSGGSELTYLGLALPRPLLGYESLRGRSRVFLAEGPFDWLTLLSWGLPACALLGTQPGPRTIELLRRVREVVLVFDTDEPGRAAAAAFAEALGERAVVLDLPDTTKDVNELSLRSDGRETFFRVLDAAERSRRDVASAG